MAWKGAVLCALLLAGLAAGQQPEQSSTAAQTGNTSRQLEPHGTAYHPLRHHQRPNDTSKLDYRRARSSDFPRFPQYPALFPPPYSSFYFPYNAPFPYPAPAPEPSAELDSRPGQHNLQEPIDRVGSDSDKLYFHGNVDDGEATSTTTPSSVVDERYNYNQHTTEKPFWPGSSGSGNTGAGGNRRNPFKLQYGWSEIDFTWPSPQARRQAVNSGAYQPHNIIPLDVDVYEHDGRQKVFVTMPRGDGVPVALATVSTEGKRKSPKLAPYPDWSWHGNGTCDRISSVYRVQVDQCSRLWVLDRGDDLLCTPQMLLFDLKNDALLSRYRFPREVIRNGSNLITVSVDIRNGKCGDAFAYIADVTVPAIIVFDARHERSWRVEHPSFRPITEYATYRIAGREFFLTDGVFGLALGPVHNGDRMLYYHALASVYESWVPTSVLRRRENFANGRNLAANQFHTSRAARASQSAAEVMDEEGTLFSGLLSETAITCWNSYLDFGGWNLPLVAHDPEALQFPSGMKNHNGKIWTMTSRYQNFATDTMDWNDINYRILVARKDDLKHGTTCDSRRTAANAIG